MLPRRTRRESERQPESSRRDSIVFVCVNLGQCVRRLEHERRRLAEGFRPAPPFQLHASKGSCTDTVRHRATMRPALALRVLRPGDDARVRAAPRPRDHPCESTFAAMIGQRHREAGRVRCGRAFQYARFSPAMPGRTSAAPAAYVLRSTPAFLDRQRYSWSEIHARRHGYRPAQGGAIARAAQPRAQSG